MFAVMMNANKNYQISVQKFLNAVTNARGSKMKKNVCLV